MDPGPSGRLGGVSCKMRVGYEAEGLIGFGGSQLVADPCGLLDGIDDSAAGHLTDYGFDMHAGDALQFGGQRTHILEVVVGLVGRGIADVGIGAFGEIPEVEVRIAETDGV